MKIIQTFLDYSESRQMQSELQENRNFGGWPSQRYHYMAWALSCLRFRQLYNEVELYTNSPGEDILIHKLELPYTKVHNCMDRLNSFPPMLWALPKIYTYSLQDSPFIHADGDVFLWRKLSPELESASLLAQSPEINHSYYKFGLEYIQHQSTDIPKEFIIDTSKDPIISLNAGIIGGNDISFFQEYARKALSYVTKNTVLFGESKETGRLNSIIEQYLFCRMAADQKKEIKYLFDHISDDFHEVVNSHHVPFRQTYLHLVGKAKRSEISCNMIAHSLKKEFPDKYQIIDNLFPSTTMPKALVKSMSYSFTVIKSKQNPASIDFESENINSFEEISAKINSGQITDIRLLAIFDEVVKYKECVSATQASEDHELDEQYLYSSFKAASDIFCDRDLREVLSIKYKIGAPYRVILLAYDIPYFLEQHDWLRWLNDNKDRFKKDEFLFIISKLNGGFKVERLISYDLFLYYFTGGPISGNDLVEILADGIELTAENRPFYEETAYEFITRSCMYFGHLVEA